MTRFQNIEDTGSFKANMGKYIKTSKPIQSPELKATKHLLNGVRKLTQAQLESALTLKQILAYLEGGR